MTPRTIASIAVLAALTSVAGAQQNGPDTLPPKSATTAPTTTPATTPAAAPAPVAIPAPQITFGGLVYAQMVYQVADTSAHLNNFDITRAYLNLNAKFASNVTARVTADAYRTTDGSLAYRLKYAYATYTPMHSGLTFKLGQIHTPWLDWEETLWDYRVQGQMALERAGYVMSADYGVGLDGAWGGEAFNLQTVLVNGEGYNKVPGDRNKDGMLRASLRLFGSDDASKVGGLRLTAYAQYGKPTGGGDRERYLAMLSYRSKRITLAGEAVVTKDSTATPATPATNGHLYSAFGTLKIIAPLAIIARADLTRPQAGSATDGLSRLIVGTSWQLSPQWRLLLDWERTAYRTAPSAAVAATSSQAFFHSQFSF